MKKQLCFDTGLTTDHRITLVQTGKDSFTVQYGAQVKHTLPYAQAAAELGQCLMHDLACRGKLENTP